MVIGVLAVQGAFAEHEQMLARLGAESREIRQKKDLEGISGLILPGGESTVQGQLLEKLELMEPIRQRILSGMPVMATCAGLILLAEHLENDPAVHLGTLPVTVRRNAYGRQTGSFTAEGTFGDMEKVPMIYIRAPYVVSAGADVRILSRDSEDRITAVRYGNQLGLSFHPELSADPGIHAYFLEMVRSSSPASSEDTQSPEAQRKTEGPCLPTSGERRLL